MSAQLKQLPTHSYRQLDLLFRHLRRVMAQQQSNRMNAENLALVFGPTIMRSPDGLSGDMEVRGTHQARNMENAGERAVGWV